MNDRQCIASQGDLTHLLSVADTTACCNFLHCFSMGCNGGHVGTPWNWFKEFGVVSGGDFEDGTYCYDYTMPRCSHHVESTETEIQSCDDVKKDEPKCKKQCVSNKEIDYRTDKNFGDSSYHIWGIDNIKSDIFNSGPVTGAFTVFEDFLTYKEGVY